MRAHLDDNRLRYLYEALRLGSIRKAAEALAVNASVVSRQIALLEADVAMALLDRHARGCRATEAGDLLVAHYRRRASDEDDTLLKLRELQGLKRGHIDLVAGEGFVADLVTGALARFWGKHPGLTMTLELAGTSEVVAAIAEDRAHVGLVYNAPADPRLSIAASVHQPIRAIVPARHPLARASAPLSLHDVAQHPLGLMAAGYGVRRILAQAEVAERIILPAKLATTSIDVLRQFLRGGLGVTLLPAFAVADDIARGALVAMPMTSGVLNAPEAHLITRAGRALPTGASHLLRHLAGHLRAMR